MTYSPRPEDADIKAKYNYLKGATPKTGTRAKHNVAAKQSDIERGSRIFLLHTRYWHQGKARILDYGGGDGSLMTSFVAQGHDCHLVDYHDNPVKGVKKIGNDVDDLATDGDYDFIVMSHVLEHVSDFQRVLIALRKQLAPEGVIYAEIPLEIWGGIRLEADPVTHINFFTHNSLLQSFSHLEFHILESKQEVSKYGNANMEVAWLVATKKDRRQSRHLENNINESLYPSRLVSLKKVMAMFIAPTIRSLVRSDAKTSRDRHL